MIIDITGISLTPGSFGKDCLGNGENFYEDGKPIECCCDECDYMMCCIDNNWEEGCFACKAANCPKNNPQSAILFIDG